MYKIRNKIILFIINIVLIIIWNISPPWSQSAALYGSWASGTNTDESDVDIWIKTDKAPSTHELTQLYKKIRNKTSSEIHILILTPEKIEHIKLNDPPFCDSLKNNSLVLEGEPV